MELKHRAASSTPELHGDRLVRFVASDETKDRYGDRILVDGTLNGKSYGDGWKTAAFERNPVFLPFHDAKVPPLGQVLRVWRDTTTRPKRLMADVLFATSNPLADVVLGLYREGAMRSVSVGFMPAPYKVHQPKSDAEREAWGLGKGGLLFGEQELWELSAVAIPANPNALALGVDDARGLEVLAARAIAEGFGELGYQLRSFLPSRSMSVSIDERAARVERSMQRLIETTEDAIDESFYDFD